jgi:hypothetical protein
VYFRVQIQLSNMMQRDPEGKLLKVENPRSILLPLSSMLFVAYYATNSRIWEWKENWQETERSPKEN